MAGMHQYLNFFNRLDVYLILLWSIQNWKLEAFYLHYQFCIAQSWQIKWVQPPRHIFDTSSNMESLYRQILFCCRYKCVWANPKEHREDALVWYCRSSPHIKASIISVTVQLIVIAVKCVDGNIFLPKLPTHKNVKNWSL